RFYRMALRGGGLTLLYASALGLIALVAIGAAALLVWPWGAWREVASRPALTFGERSPWVTEGRTLARPIALDFTEGHRVTALSAATYRVVEPGRFREWQLRPGETLSLRAGARLVLDAGAGLLLVLVLSALGLGVFGAYAAPGLSIGVPALAATFDLPAAIVPGPMGQALGALGAGVLLVLFAATALALREVLGRALR